MRRCLAILTTLALLSACGVGSVAPGQRVVGLDVKGSFFGAYVSPEYFTDSGRIAALENFERALGRQLNIVQNYHKWEVPFPTEFDKFVVNRGGILLVSWAGTSTRDILAGDYDRMIFERAQAIGRLGKPVLLRWRWEMNRPNLRREIGSAVDYVAAWKHIRRIFDDASVHNVDWVWCPIANDFESTKAPKYYPGDDQVDWLCADAYTASPDEQLSAVLSPFLAWAKSHPKPVVIGEFGTVEGNPGARATWLDDARDYLRENRQVKGVVYFESNHAPEGRFGLMTEPSALEAFRRWGQDPWFKPN